MAEKWEEQVKNLKIEQAPESLLKRITTVVPHLKQMEEVKPSALLRFVSEWRYGFVLKLASFACVAVLGVMAGQAGASGPDIVSSLVFGDIGWESVI